MPGRDLIPVIDVFAGPGGLGEGFSSYTYNSTAFKIALSIEKDPIAHQTLELRSFFRQFPPGDAPAAYYDRLHCRITTADLFDRHPQQSAAARLEAWNTALGDQTALPDLRLFGSRNFFLLILNR